MLFNAGRGSQVLVNGFCSGLQWTGSPNQSPFYPTETVNPEVPPTRCLSHPQFTIERLDSDKHHNVFKPIGKPVLCLRLEAFLAVCA